MEAWKLKETILPIYKGFPGLRIIGKLYKKNKQTPIL